MSRNYRQLLHRTILADNGVQLYGAADARLTRKGRVERLNTVDQARGLHVTTNSNALLRGLGRRRRCIAGATDDAAEHTASGPAGNTAGNSTDHAGAHVGLRFFLNYLEVLRDSLRRHQLAGVHQMRHGLANHLHSGRRRRWRRWRRRRQKDRRHQRLRQRFRVDQRNQDENGEEQNLDRHGDEDRHRLVRLLARRSGYDHFLKHGEYYLLPAGARRGCPPSLPRVLLPAAVPVTAAPPCPRQLFQATTSGAAIPKLEYVPTTIPTTRAKENARSTWPPIRNRTSTVRNVNPLVSIVRERVWLIDLFTTSAKGSRRSKRLFSRMRSKMTMVSFIEYPTNVRSAAITVSEISKCSNEKKPSV